MILKLLSSFAVVLTMVSFVSACSTKQSGSSSVELKTGSMASIFPLDKSMQKGEERKLSPFSKIDANGHGDLVITVDAAKAQAVRVESNGRSLAGVTTEVADSTLHIKIASGINPDVVRIVISVPAMTSLQTGGAFHSTVDLGQSKDVALQISGATNMTIFGHCETLNMVVSGASMVVARNLKISNCTATVSGASSASLDGTGAVDITASGASHVSLYTGGKPGKITQKANGASRIDINGDQQP